MDVAKEQSRQDTTTAAATAMTVIAAVAVVLRILTRLFVVRNFGMDDWMMISAMIFTFGYLAEIYVLRAHGMGFSGSQLTLGDMTALIQTTLAIEITYYLIVFSIKVSIVFFYLRIAVHKTFALLCKITIGVLSLFVAICVIVCVVQCVPLHKFWDLTGLVKGHCINTTAFFYSTSTFNIITDIWILALPVNMLLKIQRPKREKAALIFVFGLGIFSCIASIVRLQSIRIYTESKDPFYDSVPINLWSIIEVNIGILCASMPTLKPLLSKSQRERTRSAVRGGYAQHSNNKSGSNMGKYSGGSHHSTPGESHKMDTIVNVNPGQEDTDPHYKRSISNRSGVTSGSQEDILPSPQKIEAAHFA